MDLRLGRDFKRRAWTLQPFVGVRNVTRAKYDQTLRPNAFGGRFFEPAPLNEVYGGIEIRYGQN